MDKSTVNTRVNPDWTRTESNDLATGSDPVLEMVIARIRLRAQRRVAWLRKLWSETRNGKEQPPNYHTAIDGILRDYNSPSAEAAWMAQDKSARAWNRELARVEKALEKDRESNFAILCRQFGLTREESDMLQAIIALYMEPQLESVYAYLQDHSGRGYVTESLITRLFGYRHTLSLSALSSSRLWGIIIEKECEHGGPSRFECDAHVFHWLQGKTELDESLIGIGHFQIPHDPLPGWPMDETVQYISKMIEKAPHQPLRLCLEGSEGSGRKTFAACVSNQFGMPLLVLDTNHVADEKWNQVYIHAQRQAYLDRCALAWSGHNIEQRRWPNIVSAFQIQFIICSPGQSLPSVEGIVDHRISIPALTIEERRHIWRRHVPVSATWPEEELEEMIQRYQVTIGQIVSIARHRIESIQEATELLKESSRHQLGKLAHYMECPFNWDDLVVSEWLQKYLEDFVFEAETREQFWENKNAQRLFPQGKGLIALFSGPPGTGKTMAAQVIAAELGLDLFRIDLSSVVSKYVGETSKNLDRILSRARQMNAVLLFDEADALFGKRTEIKDAHDRYSNTDTNYLLQAIESYPGLAILASNKKGNIDAGFMRRLRFILEFSRPDTEQRFQIWKRNVKELAGEGCLAGLKTKLHFLAKTVELSGAQIKFAVLSALFISRKEHSSLTIRHLLLGLERELIKEGRGVSKELRDMVLNGN